MQKSDTLALVNMARNISVHISTLYYPTIQTRCRKSRLIALESSLYGLGRQKKNISRKRPINYRYWNTLYVKCGPMVVLMRKSQKATALRTCRAILTALALYPRFLRYAPRVRSSYILSSWAKLFCKHQLRKFTQLPLVTILKEACKSMVLIRMLCCGGRVTLPTTLNVKDLLINLHVSVCTLMDYSMKHRNYSPIVQHVKN